MRGEREEDKKFRGFGRVCYACIVVSVVGVEKGGNANRRKVTYKISCISIPFKFVQHNNIYVFGSLGSLEPEGEVLLQVEHVCKFLAQ